MQLLLVRHGRPHDVVGDAPGVDPGLDGLGQQQALDVAAALADGTYARVISLWSSHMRRALETSRPTAEALGLTVATDRRVAEFDEGASRYVGGFAGFASRREVWESINSGQWNGCIFDPIGFVERAVEGVESAVAEALATQDERTDADGGATVVFCHGGVISAYVGHVARTARPMFIAPDLGSVTRLLVEPDGYREVLSVNETAHLRRRTPDMSRSATRPTRKEGNT